MITFQRELDGGSRRTVRREKLPVKEDRKWSLEANDNWPGGQAHSRHASGQACAQNFDVVVKGGGGGKKVLHVRNARHTWSKVETAFGFSLRFLPSPFSSPLTNILPPDTCASSTP